MRFIRGSIIAVFVCLLIIFQYDRANAYNSIMDFESHNSDGSFTDFFDSLNFCGNNIMSLTEIANFNNTWIPPVIGASKPPSTNNSVATNAILIETAQMATIVTTALLGFVDGISGIIALITIATDYLIMIEICTNAYIVQPWEFVNRETMFPIGPQDAKYKVNNPLNHWNCQSKDGKYSNVGKDAATSEQVPFFYSCDPTYDPVKDKSFCTGNQTPAKDGCIPICQKGQDPQTDNCYDNSSLDYQYVGRVWGYMGSASPFCISPQNRNAEKEHIGKVLVEATHGWTGRLWSGYDRCNTNDRWRAWLKAGEMSSFYYAYYTYDTSSSKVYICVASPYTLLPLKVGCSQVAPPAESNEMPPYLEAYLNGTRCSAFLTGRTDLKSLGESLSSQDSSGHSSKAMSGFLESNFHITSTVVGCVKDLIKEVFMSPTGLMGNGYLKTGFLPYVQQNLHSMVIAALALYVAIIGIRIISSPQVPSMGEFVMFALKFALVFYFTYPSSTNNAWFHMVGQQASGLFPALLSASEYIGGWFLYAENDSNPVGLCKYLYEGSQLLQQREISIGSSNTAVNLVPTPGHTYNIILTIWDLVDCKLINYLNLGSCNYSLGGMLSLWIVSAAFFVGLNGFLLSLICLVYIWILLLVVFQFAHIFIMSMFIIAVLVLTAPIFLCFALFEATKNIFQQWFKLILGYVLYPALLMMFLALMLITFDSVYYGDIVLENNTNLMSAKEVQNKCNGVNSVYCTTVNTLKDPCGASLSDISKVYTKKTDIGNKVGGQYTTLDSASASNYFDVLLHMMLYGFLFYIFLGAATSLIAVLTGVYDLGSAAKGSIDLMKMVQMVAGKITAGAASKATEAFSKVTKK